MIDLHLRVRSRPDLKNKLLIAFDKIFNKENSLTAIKNLIREDFEHSLITLKFIAILDQLFLIEDEHNIRERHQLILFRYLFTKS